MARPCGSTGSVTLETALTLPLVALVLAAVLQLVLVVGDELVAQEAARAALRAAVTSAGPGTPHGAAAEAAAPRDVEVEVVPRRRTGGEVVRVTVRISRELGPLRTVAVGRSVGRAEAVLSP